MQSSGGWQRWLDPFRKLETSLFFWRGEGGGLGLWQGFGVCVVVFGVAVA